MSFGPIGLVRSANNFADQLIGFILKFSLNLQQVGAKIGKTLISKFQ